MKRNRYELQMFDIDSITATDADALIPVEESKSIIQGVVEQSAFLKLGRRLPNMSRAKTKMPVLDMLPTAYWVGADATNPKKKTTKLAWKNKYIVAAELAVIIPIPEDVLSDSEYDIWGEARPRLIGAFHEKIDAAGFFGVDKPTEWRDGIVPSAVAAGNVTTLSGDLYQAIMGEAGVIAKVEEDGYFVTGHAADISMRAKLRGLVDGVKQPLFKSDMQSGTNYTLDGSPITFPRNGVWNPSEALMISGDFSQMVYSVRQDITFKIFDTGVVQDPSTGEIVYNLLQDDMVALRAVMRLGWEVPNPINQMRRNEAQRFPFAVLKAGSTSGGGTTGGETTGGETTGGDPTP